ncbi:MAG: hypothetical protein H7269_04585 [Cellulomonas sp.]|nr:hypothetical protein [Cellulomonas sp.]
MTRTSTLLTTLLALAACGGSKSTTRTTTTTTETGSGAAVAAPANPPNPTGVLKSLENGDRACYVNLTTATGDVAYEGAFEPCAGGPQDATGMIGKQVQATTKLEAVQAASCEGNPECAATESVNLVETLTIVP